MERYISYNNRRSLYAEMMRRKRRNDTIENAWNMLKYLYDELKSKRFKNIDLTDIETLDDLYALVITMWCASLAKEGLYKEYVEHENEELDSPKGAINIAESLVQQTRTRGTLLCSYDELSEDIYLNHILKGTIQYLIYDNSINDIVKTKAKKAMQMFNGIGYVDINTISWKKVRFNNSNIRYKHPIELCKTLLTERKLVKTLGITDDDRMYILFKKQILKYYKEEYSLNGDIVEDIETPYINKDADTIFEQKITDRQHIVTIRDDKSALVILVKMQSDNVIRDNTLCKANLNELVGYIREFKKSNKMRVSGTIIYVNTNKKRLNLQPITVNNIKGFMIGEQTIDLHDQWRFIKLKLDDAYKMFITRFKNKTT